MSSPTQHPMQPMVVDPHGTIRFWANPIVQHLLDAGPFDMNHLAMMDFLPDDRAQFAQLIGYSVSGWSNLSYASEVQALLGDTAADLLAKEKGLL